MIDILRAEWIKVTTLRSHYVLAIIAVAFSVAIASLVAAFNDEFWTSTELADLVVGLNVVTAILIAVASVVSVTGEFSHHTTRPTFAAVPSRPRVLFAKAALNAALAAMVVGVAVLVCWTIASSLVDGEIALGDEGVVGRLVRVVAFGVILALFGLGLGLLLRNTALTVTLLVVEPFVGESILWLLFNGIGVPAWQSGCR